MSKTKIVIVIEDGNIQYIYGNKDVDVTVIDYDIIANGDEPVYKYSVDNLFKDGEAYQLIDSAFGMAEKEARDELKRLKI